MASKMKKATSSQGKRQKSVKGMPSGGRKQVLGTNPTASKKQNYGS